MIDRDFERAMREHEKRSTTLPCEAAEEMTMEARQGFDEWALVELIGHQRIAGRVTEAEIGGCKFVRVDVPARDEIQPLTKFLGPSSIYALTPVTEETARALAARIDSAPVQTWDARRLVELVESAKKTAALTATSDDASDAEDEDDEDEDLVF